MTAAPTTLATLQDAIRSSAAVALHGGGTKVRAPTGTDVEAIDVTGLRGIADYAPDEGVITVRAGTPLRDIDTALAAQGQYLPFDPPLVAAGATIGGTVAMGLSGPGRLRYGGVRDFLIGATVVDGEGRAIRSGGKVVKNAAGFLLHHALVGSQGTLAALAELTFKVFPAPAAHVTLRCRHRTFDEALATIDRAAASRLDLDALDGDATGLVWLRLAGRRDELTARVARTRRLLFPDAPGAPPAQVEVLDGAADLGVWSTAREFAWCPPGAAVVKVPSVRLQMPAIAALLPDPTRIRFSCAGAVAWIGWEGPLDILIKGLTRLGRPALVVRGPGAGRRLGRAIANDFDSRVRHALDPSHRFRAASAPSR